jgi:hypothetical protein
MVIVTDGVQALGVVARTDSGMELSEEMVRADVNARLTANVCRDGVPMAVYTVDSVDGILSRIDGWVRANWREAAHGAQGSASVYRQVAAVDAREMPKTVYTNVRRYTCLK